MILPPEYQELLKKQKGRCALSAMVLVETPGNLRSAVLDYYGENDLEKRLICRWVNDAKRLSPSSDFINLLSELRESPFLTRMQVSGPKRGKSRKDFIPDVDKIFVILGEELQQAFWLEGLSISVGITGGEEDMLATIYVDFEQASFDTMPANQPAITIKQPHPEDGGTGEVDCAAYAGDVGTDRTLLEETFEFADPQFVGNVIDFMRRGLELRRLSK